MPSDATGACSPFAQVLIRQAWTLYANDTLEIDHHAMVFVLDSTSIELCFALFDWAPFRSPKAAIEMQSLIDLHASIKALINNSAGKLHYVNVLHMLTCKRGAYDVFDRWRVDI